MNSAALRFVPVAELEEQGYGDYRRLFERFDKPSDRSDDQENAS